MFDTNYMIKKVKDHYEVYINDKFYCSSDTYTEAVNEIDSYYKELEN